MAKTEQTVDDLFDEALKEIDSDSSNLEPIFWNGMIVGTKQDLIDGKIDPLDRDQWR